MAMRDHAKAMAAPIGCYLVLLLLIFSKLMNFELRKDEQLYAPPARLLGDLHLYSDFFYNHTPGSAWLFYGVMNALRTDHLLLAARLGVFAAWIVFGISLIVITYKLTRSSIMACLAVALIMANEALLNQTGMTATNNLLPLASAYLGLGLFLLGINGAQPRPYLMVASGLALSLAAAFKANAFVFIPIVAAASFFLPRQALFSERLKKVVAPLALGGILGALPVFAYLIAEPERFLTHVVGFHTGPHIAYWAAQTAGEEEAVVMTASAKLLFAYSNWLSGANLLFIFAITFLFSCIAMAGSAMQLGRRLLSGQIIMVLACLLAAIAMSLVPTPGFPQYYTVPLACAPLLLSLLYAELRTEERRSAQPALLALTVIVLLLGIPHLIQYAARLPFPDGWTVERVHNDGVKIAAELSAAGVSGKVATLAPIYPLESGLAVYPEFATGQFAYRTAPFTAASQKKLYRSTSPDEVGAFLAADPPAAILVGFEPKLEAPLVQFAEMKGYRRIGNLGIASRYGELVLYVRQTSALPN